MNTADRKLEDLFEDLYSVLHNGQKQNKAMEARMDQLETENRQLLQMLEDLSTDTSNSSSIASLRKGMLSLEAEKARKEENEQRVETFLKQLGERMTQLEKRVEETAALAQDACTRLQKLEKSTVVLEKSSERMEGEVFALQQKQQLLQRQLENLGVTVNSEHEGELIALHAKTEALLGYREKFGNDLALLQEEVHMLETQDLPGVDKRLKGYDERMEKLWEEVLSLQMILERKTEK